MLVQYASSFVLPGAERHQRSKGYRSANLTLLDDLPSVHSVRRCNSGRASIHKPPVDVCRPQGRCEHHAV